MKEEIIEEFHNIALAQDYITQGGIGYAKTVLEKALGMEQAQTIINRLTSSLQVRPSTLHVELTHRKFLTLFKMNIRKRLPLFFLI